MSQLAQEHIWATCCRVAETYHIDARVKQEVGEAEKAVLETSEDGYVYDIVEEVLHVRQPGR